MSNQNLQGTTDGHETTLKVISDLQIQGKYYIGAIYFFAVATAANRKESINSLLYG